MPKADLLKIYETYRQANLIQEGMKVVEAPAGDASAANMGPGGVIEVQPDGQYPEGEAPKQNVDAEEGGGPYVEIARGQLILDVEGQRVKVVFHPAGDIDIFDSKNNVVDSDNPHFQAIDDFIQKVVS